eukprot:tig00021126_g18472.t1
MSGFVLGAALTRPVASRPGVPSVSCSAGCPLRRPATRFSAVGRRRDISFGFGGGRGLVIFCEDKASPARKTQPSSPPASPSSPATPASPAAAAKDAASALSKRLERLLVFFADKDRDAWYGLVAASKNWNQVHGDFLDFLAGERAKGSEAAAPLAVIEALLDELPRIEGKLRRSEELLEGFMRTRASRWREFVERHASELDEEFLLYVNCRIERTEDYNERLDYDVALTSIIDFAELLKAEEKTAALQVEGERGMGKIGVPEGGAGPRSHGDGYEKIDIDTSIGRVQAPSPRLDPTEAPAGSLGRGLERVRRLYRAQPEGKGLQLPLEVQIVQYMLMIADPLERRLALRDVFVPDRALKCDPELEELYSTPENLLAAVDALAESYEKQRGDPGIRKYLEESNLLESLAALRADVLRFVVEETGGLQNPPPGYGDDDDDEGEGRAEGPQAPAPQA